MKNILTFIAGITIGAIGGYIASHIVANKKLEVAINDFQKREREIHERCDQDYEKNIISSNNKESNESNEANDEDSIDDADISKNSSYAYPIDESEYGEFDEYNRMVVQYYCGNLIDNDGCALDDEKSAILPENIEKDINDLSGTADRLDYVYSRNDSRKTDYEIEVIYEDDE